MSLKLIHPGLLTTVQDLGRTGYQQYGVVVSGAMDRLSLRIANMLVGNREDEAALEITLRGPELAVQQDTLLAICGADLSPTVDGIALPQWRPVLVGTGGVVRFGPCRSGCRAYVAVAGGIDVPQVLGSRSTYLRGGLGGFEGRMLKAGDVVKQGPAGERSARLAKRLTERLTPDRPFQAAAWHIHPPHMAAVSEPLGVRVTPGAQLGRLDQDSRKRLFGSVFEVSPQSDRMGYRLQGAALRQTSTEELLSEAVPPGTVQLPSDGSPIILLADRQTTGGYPRIAHVVSADLPALGQAKPGDKLRFRPVTLEQAERLYLLQEREMAQIRMGIRLKLQNKMDKEM
ncbi:biotin-dependent carboxyltransferase family protein [Paenibacillus doosanensis]|uniref:KipI antagonist n=1 Tax=Paenibacillus konkukensis TaxID=2020716 RepID=A0ABY4RTW4_9BACL|nr:MULTISPECIES: biotin-dependent carboxyltransferase family protein [Paenibacillus]MCS7461188.1 biotin-dependent carboxyltransferase family protein [Paenibacillus doosanensis]UQZ85427.1 KipI antagonist [Paenibacillus konkukensis]